MIPKIVFKYSLIYDEHWKEYYALKKWECSWYKPEEIEGYIEDFKKIWCQKEQEILKELSEVSGLKWQEPVIVCYIVGKCIPFSDPLTMHPYKDKTLFNDVLIHELIHQLFIQNEAEKAWEHIENKYPNESFRVRVHIVLNAILSHIYYKFYDESRLKRDVARANTLESIYARAWDIVQKEGYEKIIKEFKSKIVT